MDMMELKEKLKDAVENLESKEIELKQLKY